MDETSQTADETSQSADETSQNFSAQSNTQKETDISTSDTSKPERISKKSPIPMLAVLYCVAFITAFNENIMNVALVDIMDEFSISTITAQWLVTGYMIATTVVTALTAYLLCRFSYRRLFFAAGGFFILGSATAPFAPTFPFLLLARVVQSVGTGMFLPIMMSSVLALAPRERLATFMSIGGCCITLGPAFGPVVAGLMVTFFGWRTVFIPSLMAIVILVIVGIFFVKNFDEPQDLKLDVLSVILLVIGLVLICYGLTQIMTNIVVSLACIVVGAIFIGVFAYRQGHIKCPLLNLSPLQHLSFAFGTLLALFAVMTTFSTSVLLPLYFQSALLVSALVSGIFILIPVICNAFTALLGGFVMDRKGAWPLLPVGFAIITVGQIFIWLLAQKMNAVLVILGACFVFSGVGLVLSPSQTTAIGCLSREENEYGVSIMNVFTQAATCLGPSFFVGVLSAATLSAKSAGFEAVIAEAMGFSHAIMYAAILGGIATIIALFFAFKNRGRKVSDPNSPSDEKSIEDQV